MMLKELLKLRCEWRWKELLCFGWCWSWRQFGCVESKVLDLHKRLFRWRRCGLSLWAKWCATDVVQFWSCWVVPSGDDVVCWCLCGLLWLSCSENSSMMCDGLLLQFVVAELLGKCHVVGDLRKLWVVSSWGCDWISAAVMLVMCSRWCCCSQMRLGAVFFLCFSFRSWTIFPEKTWKIVTVICVFFLEYEYVCCCCWILNSLMLIIKQTA